MENLSTWLKERRDKGLLRSLTPIIRSDQGIIQHILPTSPEPGLIDFSSNDYLGLTQHPALISKSIDYLKKYGAGAGAARLMSGDLAINHELETEIAKFKAQEKALIFGSGFLANTGVIPALAGRGDAIFSDRLNHASIYDGCKLSDARLIRFQHNDMNNLELLLKKERPKFKEALIIGESIYSMDGDQCPLRELVELKNKYSCTLIIDEAHATGMFGKNGAGIIEKEQLMDQVDLVIGTFGKALGSYGAYIAGKNKFIEYSLNKARSFIFSTALPPSVIGASLAGLEIIRNQPDLRKQVIENSRFFRNILNSNGINTGPGKSQIIPVVVGENKKAIAIARELVSNGYYVKAIRPPTVPENTARLRFSITAHHSRPVLKKTAEMVISLL
jgi:8-amino-7-oxononanoate synthase